MLEYLIFNYKPIAKILFIMICFIIVSVVIFQKNIKEYLRDNWKDYRSNPLFMPFAGFISREKNETVLEASKRNFTSILNNIVTNILKILMIPIYPIIQGFISIISVFKNVLNNIRGQISVVRNILFRLFEKMYIRLQNGIAAIMFFFLKLREGMKRSFGLFNIVLYSIEHSYLFFRSMMNSPIGEFGKIADGIGISTAIFALGPFGPQSWRGAMCFNPYTRIKLDNGEYEYMTNIGVGDVLEDNNEVLATLNIITKDKFIFDINNIEVTGEHIVKYGDKWVKVEKHPERLLKRYDLDSLSCLITKNGIINIENTIFRDFIDTHDVETNRYIRNIIINHLNNESLENKHNGSYCDDNIYGIEDNITHSSICGRVVIKPNTIDMYKLYGKKLSGNVIVYEKGKWLRVCNHQGAVYVGKNNVKCYHYITQSGIIDLGDNLIIRDFIEVKNDSIDNIIDRYIEKSLNNIR
tara:strand:- start:661 stop:2061 length:1401 start_codon:yes stop_codon:yes gene_type:complete